MFDEQVPYSNKQNSFWQWQMSYCNKQCSFGVVGDMFHGTLIIDGVYKVEMQGVTFHETTLFQPNFEDDLTQ